MARPLPCFSSYCDTCSLSHQSEEIDNEDCSSLYSSEPITETGQGDPEHSSLVTGVTARAKDQVKKSSQVTGVIVEPCVEHRTLQQGPTSATHSAQKTTAQTAAPDP
uniref:Uncharacterized protein n=1 Tax=Amphimedon queenslandica TaxID=400682 RepID=A0A1X7VDL3_AMPQE